MDTDKDKTIAGRTRHSVRAVLCVLTDGGQRTARPTRSIRNTTLQLRARMTKLHAAGA